jgi:probable F420-dependent oxidoreductase
MRFGIATPIVVRLPGNHAEWERGAGIAELAAIARAADGLGYHHLTCSEHVALPRSVEAVRGVTYWDPLATFGYLAAVTERIRFATNVLVLGYHHPLDIAKQYGTLDRVSGGRLILGLGVGSLKEEFDLLGAPFDDRGARADDALRALRASLGRREPTYAGTFYRYDGMIVDPCAVQERIPLWMGGRTLRSLRRAAALADGWSPFALTLDQTAAMLAKADIPDGFEVVLSAGHRLDPLGDAAGTKRALEEVRRAGATIVNATFVHDSVARYLEQLEAFTHLVPSQEWTP